MKLSVLGLALALSGPCAAQDFFTLKGHGGPIMDIAVSPSGQIATASFDNSVGVWSATTPTWLEGHKAAVNSVTFLDDGIVSAGDDFQIIQWTDEKADVLGAHKGKVADLVVMGGTIASASWDGTIGLWAENTPPIFLKGHTQGVNAVTFGVYGVNLFSASADGTIRVWDVTTAQQTQQFVKHGFGINTLILNEVDGWLAYGAVDGVTRLVDLNTGAAIADFTLDRRPILSMAYHPKTHLLAVGDGEGFIMVIDTKNRKIVRDFRATRQGPIWALAFSPDGQNIHAGGVEDTLYSWPVATMDQHGQMNAQPRSFLEDPETLPNGERQFKRKCSICHTLTEADQRRAGPSLAGLFGRRAGGMKGYSYSDTLRASQIVWSAETISDLFDIGPDHYIPGSKMPMQRITKSQDRDDLIDYLRVATAQGRN